MKVLHQDIEGDLIVLMKLSEWERATGDTDIGQVNIGSEAEVLDTKAAEVRLRRAYEKIGEVLGVKP